MLFYEFKITLPNVVAFPNPRQGLYSMMMSKLVSDVESANTKLPENTKFFIVSIKGKTLTLAGAVGYRFFDEPADMATRFAKDLGYTVVSVKGGEVTLRSFLDLLGKARENSFIRDYNDLLIELNIKDPDSSLSYDAEEFLTDAKEKKENIFHWAGNSVCCEELTSELERIYEGEDTKEFSAHPVHYIIYCDDKEGEKTVIRCLTAALHARGRLKSRRVDIIRSKPKKDFFEIETIPTLNMDSVKSIYNIAAGGTVVLCPENLDMPGKVTFSGMTSGEALADEILAHRHDSLTILLFSRKDTDAATYLKQRLCNMRFVEIKESLMSPENSVCYLETKAMKMGFNYPSSLIDIVDHGSKGYYSEELNKMYDKWLDNILCNEVYPQYSTIVHPDPLKTYNKGEAYDKLKKLIGLEKAKSIVDKAIKFNSFQKLFKEKGNSELRMSRHMVFSGNPGTAKTTVARLFAQIMKDNEILPVGKLIEVGRTELVGQYVGWTAKQVANVFKEAMGSVLFIDEAYSLVEEDGLYGDEAINTIVQCMENQRNDTIVIFAGYPDKMQKFLDKNPGLRSRIAFHVNFDDYNLDQLFEILSLMTRDNGMELDPDVRTKFSDIASEAMLSKDFGNGRFVRNLFEQAVMSRASRVMDMSFSNISDKDLMTLKACDFFMPEELAAKPAYRSIGFSG